MKIAFGIALAALLIGGVGKADAVAANACRQCGDFRKRCMANYPGPTCKTDYDICMKSCQKK
jgi:hypothetical protein